MKKLMNLLEIAAISFIWFLISPFPFENEGWLWLGGLRLINATLPFGDGFQHEVDISQSYYTSHWYSALLVLSSGVIGFVSYTLITRTVQWSRFQ